MHGSSMGNAGGMPASRAYAKPQERLRRFHLTGQPENTRRKNRQPLGQPGLIVEKSHGLQRGNLECLTAADVCTGQFFIASYHVRLCLGEFGAVALVGTPGQLLPLAPHNPGHFVLTGLPAPGTNQRMRALLGCFVKKIAFFHDLPTLHPVAKTVAKNMGTREVFIPREKISRREARTSHSGGFYSILVLAMTKRKPAKFSVTKAVKANARERVGQPKPARVISTEPRTGRAAKHKPKLEELLRQEES
jgi:hypothetical protein